MLTRIRRNAPPPGKTVSRRSRLVDLVQGIFEGPLNRLETLAGDSDSAIAARPLRQQELRVFVLIVGAVRELPQLLVGDAEELGKLVGTGCLQDLFGHVMALEGSPRTSLI